MYSLYFLNISLHHFFTFIFLTKDEILYHINIHQACVLSFSLNFRETVKKCLRGSFSIFQYQ